MAHRFRRDLLPDDNLSECICGYNFTTPKALPSHFHSCVKYKRTSINQRHDRINNTVLAFCREAGISATFIPRDPSQNDRRVPDGRQWLERGLNYTDVTCRHPITATSLRYAKRVGRILDIAVLGKHKKYELWATNREASFCALAINSYGVISAEFHDFLHEIAKHAVDNNLSPIDNKEMFVNRMIQHIVVTLMKGNAWIYTKGIRDGKLLRFPADIAEFEEHVNRNISNLASNKRNEKLCSL